MNNLMSIFANKTLLITGDNSSLGNAALNAKINSMSVIFIITQ